MTAGRCAVLQRDADGDPTYSCEKCATTFDIPDGFVIECPTCAAMEDAPPLKECPHCGGSASLEVAWEGGTTKRQSGRFEPAKVFRAICQTCGCQTRGCAYADDAACAWNDRVEGSA